MPGTGRPSSLRPGVNGRTGCRGGRWRHLPNRQTQAQAALVDVAFVSLRLPQILDILLRLLGCPPAVRLDNSVELAVDVGGHALFVAAHEELGAVLEPGPN